MALTKIGYTVCLIEKSRHPRFAIGESSTPIADMILRDLADDYDLPFLKKLSRYGEWQKYYPEIGCGLKRGFSYYHHKKGERFRSNDYHSNELLVAASENNQNSDTHWLRSDVDHFLVKKATEMGVNYLDLTEILKLSRIPENESWSVYLKSPQGLKEIECEWIIDATGSSKFSTTFLNTKSSSDGFKTHSSALYTHFEKVKRWSEYLESNRFNISDYPYNPDHSALHHLIDEGWIWMLRFNNGRLSAGILFDESNNAVDLSGSSSEKWDSVIRKYPSLQNLFSRDRIADPPNRFMETDRLQRRLDRVYGNGWIALPHTVGFVDPLHSTGIAHTLSGVEAILKLFGKKLNHKEKVKGLKKYQENTFNELNIIDLLVSICYKSRTNFELFTACTMLYFIASIRYEQIRLTGEIPDTFLCAGETEIRQIIQETYDEIQQLKMNSLTKTEIRKQVHKIRQRIEPYNFLGLMNPEFNNMYKHTTVEL